MKTQRYNKLITYSLPVHILYNNKRRGTVEIIWHGMKLQSRSQ